MKIEGSNRQYGPDSEGVAAIVRACKCGTCKNYFWVPSDGDDATEDARELTAHLLPNFCPFCGTKFESPDVKLLEDDEVKEMEALLGVK